MIHLAKMIGRKKEKRKYTCPPDRGNHIVYMINGYWFWLNMTQWGKFMLIRRKTIAYRMSIGRPLGECLGIDKLKRARRSK